MNLKNKRIMRVKRILVLGVLALVLAVVSGSFLINKIADRKLRQIFAQSPPGLKLSFRSLHIPILSSSLQINDLLIIFQNPSGPGQQEHVLKFPLVEIKGIDFLGLLSRKNLHVRELILGNGEITLDQALLDHMDSSQFSFLENSPIPFEHILIDHLKISANNLLVKGAETVEQVSGKTELLFNGIEINKSATIPHIHRFHLIGTEWQIRDISYPVPSSHHRLSIKKFTLNSNTEMASLDSVRIIPEFGKFEFGRKIGQQSDRIEASISRIECSSFDFQALFNKKLIAKKVLVKESSIHIFRDRRIPRGLQAKPLPVSYLNKMSWTFRVDSLKVAQSSAEYEEFPQDGNQSGTLKIENMQAVLSPFMNHPAGKDRDSMQLNISGAIMGSGSVRARISLPLENPPLYLVRGAITNLDLTSLNGSAENLGLIHIESGILNKLDFQFTMSEQKATGKIIGEYHDLIIDKLKEGRNHEKKEAGFKSFALKHFIIPKNKDKTLSLASRSGKIDYKRDPTRYISYYLLHSLLTGIKSSFTFGFLLPS
jgi:hypothetical protein